MNKPFVLAGMPRRIRTPAIVSSALVLPLMILELVNRWGYHEVFPIPLFALLWLLPLSFMVVLMPILRGLPAGDRGPVTRLSFISGLILLTLIAWLWVSIVIDQMPCFLGVMHCD